MSPPPGSPRARHDDQPIRGRPTLVLWAAYAAYARYWARRTVPHPSAAPALIRMRARRRAAQRFAQVVRATIHNLPGKPR